MSGPTRDPWIEIFELDGYTDYIRSGPTRDPWIEI